MRKNDWMIEPTPRDLFPAARRHTATRAAWLLASTALISPLVLPGGASAQNVPTGASVAAGSVTIVQPSATQLNITQSSRSAVVNWQGFSVGQGSAVNLAQPDSTSAILNRVTGNTSSTIAGSITANGQVYLVNPNGIAITKSGTVNTGGGFVASTLGISDAEFQSGKRTFSGNGASAAVSNAGSINVGRGGYAALIGGTVSNSGSINVPLGKAGLGSGERATLDFSGDGFLQVAVPTNAGGKHALIKNSGSITANGGSVTISAATAREAARNAVNISGLVQARSISGHSGAITIGGGGGGKVRITGRLIATSRHASGGAIQVTGHTVKLKGATVDASGKTGGGAIKLGEAYTTPGSGALTGTTSIDGTSTVRADAIASGNGGSVTVSSDGTTRSSGLITALGGTGGAGGIVQVLGQNVALENKAIVDVSGPSGGGTALIGGDYQGKNTAIQNATRTFVGSDAVIKADATRSGDGGKVIVWSDDRTQFYGAISAKGGPQGGDGGSVEVSGKQTLVFDGHVDTSAPKGALGRLLLDPTDVNVVASGGDTSNTAAVDQFADPDLHSGGTSINVSAINSSASTVTLQATHDVNVNADVNMTTSGAGFVAQAGHSVNVNNSIATKNGAITLSARDPGTTQVAGGTVSIVAGLNSAGGAINVTNHGSTSAIQLAGVVDAGVGSDNFSDAVSLTTGSSLVDGGGITFGSTVNGPFGLSANSSAGTTTFSGAVGGSTPLAFLVANVDVAINGGTVTTTGVQTYGAVTLGASTTLTSTGSGNITLGRNLNGGIFNALTINAGTGTVTIGGNIGALNTSIGAVSDLDITAGKIALNGSVIRIDPPLGASSVTFNGPVVLGTDVTIQIDGGTGNGADLLFNGTVQGSTAFGQKLGISNQQSFAGDVTFNGVVGGSGKQLGDVVIGGATQFGTARNVTINAAFNAKSLNVVAGPGSGSPAPDILSFNSAGQTITTAGGTDQNGGDVTIKAGRLSGALTTGTIDARGGSVSVGTTGLNGGNVSLTSPSGNVTVGAIDTSGSAAKAGSGANGGNAGTITLDAGAASPTITLNGNVTALGGAGDGAGARGTTQAISFPDPVVLGADSAITGGALTFASTVTAGTHALTLATDTSIALNGGANSVSGTGTITLQTVTAGTSIGVAGAAGTLQVTSADLDALADGFTQITIGRADGAGTTTVNAVTFKDPTLIQQPNAGGNIVVNGAITGTGDASLQLVSDGTIAVGAPVNIAGGAITLTSTGSSSDVTIAGDITRSGTGAATLRVNAGRNIIVQQGVTIQQATNLGANDKLNIVFNADSDANGAGRIDLQGAAGAGNGVAFTTNGGNITLGGRDNTLTGAVTGVATGDAANPVGVRLTDATLTAGAGSIALFGHGGTVGGGLNFGVHLSSSSVTANGGVTISGTGGSGGDFNVGVNSEASQVSSTGAIAITGQGGTGGSSDYGVGLFTGSGLTATAAGTITIHGTGAVSGGGGGANYGVIISGSGVSAADGAVSITGTGAIRN